jgi:hypothetical protein
MSSFDLAMEYYAKPQNGGYKGDRLVDKAVEVAKELTYRSMFDYSTLNKPRYFQSATAKVVLQFKQFSQQMTYMLVRSAYEGFHKKFDANERTDIGKEINATQRINNEPEYSGDALQKQIDKYITDLREEGKKRLMGTLGMTFLFAGTTGLPGWWALGKIIEAVNAVFGDEDEPFDFDNWFKNWANRTFGGFAGDTISRGLLSQATGLNFADRMNLNLPDMWFPDVRKSQSEVDYVQNMFINTLGPSMGALLVSYPEAIKRFNDGHTERAMEALMPAAIKNVMVGTRYMVDGQALTLKGNTLVEDISAREALSQMLGFSPERVAQKQQAAFQTKNANESIMNRRTDLLNAFFISIDTGDAEMTAKVIEKMVTFSQTNPGVRIDPEALVDSIEKRYKDRALANITGGMGLNKNLIPQLLPMLEYGEQ